MSSYWINGKDSLSVHDTREILLYVRCKSENGIISFEFTRPLDPRCSGRVECKNIIDPYLPLKIVWHTGAIWSKEHLSDRNMHSQTNSQTMLVHLMRGAIEVDEALFPVLAVHGFLMFLAWGILLPRGVLAARYLKHLKGDG